MEVANDTSMSLIAGDPESEFSTHLSAAIGQVGGGQLATVGTSLSGAMLDVIEPNLRSARRQFGVTPAPVIRHDFQAGHGWLKNGNTPPTDDTVDFIRGRQSAQVSGIVTPHVAKYVMPAFDLVDKSIRIVFKINIPPTKLAYATLRVGDTSLANYYEFRVNGTGTYQAGQWTTIEMTPTVPFARGGTYGVNADGTMSTLTGFTDLRVKFYEKSGEPAATLNVQSIEIIPSPAEAFPRGCLSITFDDGRDRIFSLARPKMDSLGFRGTSYVIGASVGNSLFMTLEENKILARESGWEIGAHAFDLHGGGSGSGFVDFTTPELHTDLLKMRRWLLGNGFPADSLAYPKGQFGVNKSGDLVDAIAGEYFSTCRTIDSGQQPGPPKFTRTRLPAYTGISDNYPTTSTFNPVNMASPGGVLDQVKAGKTWVVLVFHVITDGPATQSTECSKAAFDTLMDAIAAKGIEVLPVNEAAARLA